MLQPPVFRWSKFMKTHPVPPLHYFLKLCIYPIIFDVLRCTCISIVIVVIKVMLYTYCLYVFRTNDSAVVFIIFRYSRRILWLPTTSPPLVMACCSCSWTFFLALLFLGLSSSDLQLFLESVIIIIFYWICGTSPASSDCFPGLVVWCCAPWMSVSRGPRLHLNSSCFVHLLALSSRQSSCHDKILPK